MIVMELDEHYEPYDEYYINVLWVD